MRLGERDNCRGWAAAGVNHKLIFELDPRHHSSHLDLLEIAAWLSTIWAAGIVTFIFADYIHIPAFYCPLAVMITFAVFLFNPLRIFKYQARRWLIKIILRILLAPIPLVVFADFWVSPPFPYDLSELFYFSSLINSTPSHQL